MYSKTFNNVTFFNDESIQNTEKCVYGRISEAIKTDKKNEDGKDVYEFELWNARFVGKAKEKALQLSDKDKITLREWTVRNPYDKEKKKSYPYMLVTDFEIKE